MLLENPEKIAFDVLNLLLCCGLCHYNGENDR